MFNDIDTVAQARIPTWRSNIVYVFRVLGVDPAVDRIIGLMYVAYLLVLLGGWVWLSWDAGLRVAGSLHVPHAHVLAGAIPGVLTIIAMFQVVLSLGRLPFRLPHGDLEWLGPAPVSRRAIALFPFFVGQLRSGIVWGFVGSLLLAALHIGPSPNLWGSAIFSLWGMTIAGWTFCLSTIRTMVHGHPPRFLWIIPLVLFLVILITWPQGALLAAKTSMAPITSHHVEGIGENIILWLSGWVVMLLFTPHINLITIHDGSDFYADLRALGTIYTNNRSLQLDLRLAARMRRRRPLLSVPNWPLPWWETGRWVVAQIRTPRQLIASIEIGLLLRVALNLSLTTQPGMPWILWLLACYRFNQGGTTLFLRRDHGAQFIRQFWLDTTPERALVSSLTPLIFITTVAYVTWILLPLAVPVTAFHAAAMLALIFAWHYSESVAVVRQVTLFGQSDSGREVRTVVMAIMFVTAMVHNMHIFFAIPAILVWLSLRGLPLPWRAPHSQHKDMTSSRV